MGNTESLDERATLKFCNIVYDMETFAEKPFFDDEIAPTHACIPLSQGFNSMSGGFEVKWSHQPTAGGLSDYHIHYKEPFALSNPVIQYRFDRHENPHSPLRHFHKPRDASDHAPSCIKVDQLPLVARAVAKTWRKAYEEDDYNLVNDLQNPP